MPGKKQALPYVLFRLQETLCALSVRHVREIAQMPSVIQIPQAPATIRGAINQRGKIVKLIDLRIKLGLPALTEELLALHQLLAEREQDHRRWLAELEAAIREHRPFGLARDPHRCKFGQWYDQCATRNRLLQMTLPAMDAPHKAIHATAGKALELVEKGAVSAALELIESRRQLELSALVRLFVESRRILAEGSRELAIVLARENHWVAFAADMVESTESIPEASLEPLPEPLASHRRELACRIGRRAKTNEIVLVFSGDFFFQHA